MLRSAKRFICVTVSNNYMTIDQLHNQLNQLGIPDDWYYIHGLYGATDDNEKLALVIKLDGPEVYFKEYGVKTSLHKFRTEDEACNYMFLHLKDEWTFNQINKIEGLDGMTVNERLYVSGLSDEFESCLKNNKTRAKLILRWLRIDEESIKEIVK